MRTITWLAAALTFACGAGTYAQSAPVDAELGKLVADCNAIAGSSNPKGRNIKACETLADDGRLSLVEPAAATAYQRYLDERVLECQRRQASPRGQSRGLKDCEP